MKTKDLKTKSQGDLRSTVQSLKEKSRDLRFKLASGKVKNVREIRQTKKDIARIMTVLNEKQNA
ncbi:MAG: 50S ribosomal protein L29 [bacterium]|nr:50S ribosomal protein L29 [bacterium]MDZ4232096.1 50S ribosomal protein L29 [Candidatus Pacearchaeota archaeon]